MKKSNFVASAICAASLAGCAGAAGDGSVSDTFGYSFHSEVAGWQSVFPFHEAIAYHDHGVSYNEAEEWKEANIPYEQAIKWHSIGFSPDDAKLALASGVKSADEVAPWYYQLAPMFSQSKPLPTQIVSYASNAGTSYTPADVAAVLQNTSAPIGNINEVIALARQVHTGTPVSQLPSQLTAMRDEVAKQQMAADAQAQAQQKQARVDRYGAVVLAACKGKITQANMIVTSENPYATQGLCIEATIRSVWGQIQWLNEHSLLLTDGLPNGQEPMSTIITDPNGALHLNAQAVLMGVKPITYTSVLGAQTVAPTFVVVKYLN